MYYEVNYSNFKPKLKKIEKSTPKNVLYFRKWISLAPRLKKFLYFWKLIFPANFSDILGQNFQSSKFFLHFRKWNFLPLPSSLKNFLICQEQTCKVWKETKKLCSGKTFLSFLTILQSLQQVYIKFTYKLF